MQSGTMAENFLISIDHENGEELDLKTISFLNRVHIRVHPQNYHSTVVFIRSHFASFNTYCDVTALKDVSQIVSLLENGVAKVFVSTSQLKQIREEGVIDDFGRLIVSVGQSGRKCDSPSPEEDFQAEIKSLIENIPVAVQVDDTDQLAWLKDGQTRRRYVNLTNPTLPNYVHAVQAGHIPTIPANILTADSNKPPNFIAVHQLITAVIRSDRADGLFPTVVVDELGSCLGLVYSNEKSVESALRLGRGVYHSRSRNGLWIKGEESGDVQELIKIGWDCDADALSFTVRQMGDGEPA